MLAVSLALTLLDIFMLLWNLDAKFVHNASFMCLGKNKGNVEALLSGERALTEFGSNFEPRRDSATMSDVSMTT